MSLVQRIQEAHSAPTVSLARVADIVERLKRGQVPSAETQAAAWTEVLTALDILIHAVQHTDKGPADCGPGNGDCPYNDETSA